MNGESKPYDPHAPVAIGYTDNQPWSPEFIRRDSIVPQTFLAPGELASASFAPGIALLALVGLCYLLMRGK